MQKLLPKSLFLLATLVLTVFSAGTLPTDAAILNVPSLGAGAAGTLDGWYADDMRSDGTGGIAGSTNLIGINRTINTATHGAIYVGPQPAAGIAGHDAAIDNQVIFGAAPGTPPVSTWGGAVNLRSSDATPNTKSQISSIVDGTVGSGSGSTGGHAQGSVLDSLSTFTYSWYGQGTSSQTPSLKFGIKTIDFASIGSSSRTGENVWDKVLVYEPGQNGQTSDMTWHTEMVDFTTGKWSLYDRASGGGGVSGATVTLSDWSTDNTTLFNNTSNPGATLQDMYNLFADDDSLITSVQLGIGSSATLGDVFVNQLEVNFLNGGDAITFGTEPEPSVPEPGSLALLGLGLIGFATRRRRRR